MSTTHSQGLENIIVKLRAQDIAPWRIAYCAIKDERYLSSNKYTDSHTSSRLHALAQKCGCKDQDISQLLGANQPVIVFPDQIITAMKKLIVDHNLEPSVIVHNINAPLPFDTSWGVKYNIIYGYTLAHDSKDYVLDELYTPACKIQQDAKIKENAQAVSELFYTN